MIRLEDIIARLRDEDSFFAIEAVCRGPDALASAKLFSEAANHFYWKEKDLSAAITLGRAGAQFALAAAARLDADDVPLALQLRGQAKAMAYNLASFTWPGWDEPGIIIGPFELAAGLDAAKANLLLAIELKKDALPMSRAHWMLGAQELAAGKHNDAVRRFNSACEQADVAGAEAERWLSVGFGVLSEMLAAASDSEEMGRKERLDESRARLRPLENGEMFIQQIETAARVFGKRIGS
jgi:hypothetical protein